MWIVSLLICALVTASVPLLCMVSSAPKCKEKKDEESEEETEERSDAGLEDVESETKVEMKEDSVKVDSRPTEPDTKATKDETTGVRIAGLDCASTFKNLTPKERLYAHHTARAYFEGALIVFLQRSPEAAPTFVLLYRIFWFDSIAELKDKADYLGITDNEWLNFLMWSAMKLTVRGKHIIPIISQAKLWKLIASSTAASIYPDLIPMYESVEKAIFSNLPPPAKPGFPTNGMNHNAITKRDYNACNAVVMRKRLDRSNCRFFKEDVDGEKILKIKVASTDTDSAVEMIMGMKVYIEKGDYSKILESVCAHLKKASEHASSIQQKGMLCKLSEHFKTAECEKVLMANSLFLIDRNPIVRSQYFFKENCRGPPGQRSDFVGFVAVVNKEASEKCSRLVEKWSRILEKLPWGKNYEKEKLGKPEFAILDIIANGLINLEIGHNFTNQITMGRSHVFSNVISALSISTQFIREQDQELFREYHRSAQQVFTGLHELFGHGSGKDFKRQTNGSFNFDMENTMDILTGCNVTSWYEPNQSYVSVFGDLALAFEECRAYAVAYLLCCDTEVLEALGYKGASGQKLKYAIWLRQLREGLRALVVYDRTSKKWREGHSWARYVILKVILEAGEGCLTIEQTKNDLKINLDKSKIDSVGMPSIRKFLKKLQAYRSTADVKGARALFNRYGVDESEILRWFISLLHEIQRNETLEFVQPNTMLTKEGGVQLVTYEETPEGVIQSVIDRYTPESVANLEAAWKAEKKQREVETSPY